MKIETIIPLKTAAIGGFWRVEIQRPQSCSKCDGTGWRLAGRACSVCKGAGLVTNLASVMVEVPANSRNNRVVVTRGEGGAGSDGGPPGDLWVTLKVAPHPTLVRKALDLWTEVEVDTKLARAGGQVEVRNLTDLVDVIVAAGTLDRQVIRVRGAGVPGPGGRLPGDLHVRIRVK